MKKDEKEKEPAPDMYEYKDESGVKYAKHGVPKRIRNYWRRLMDSTQKKMSLGSANIARMISWARGDNWRRQGGWRRRSSAKKPKKD